MTQDPFASKRRPDGRFVNLHASTDHTLAEVWRWRAHRKAPVWPRWIEDPPHPPPARLPPGRIGATFIGHASWLVQIGGRALLLDPLWSARASPVPGIGPRRVRAPGQALGALPRVDAVLVSHNHYDHLDLPSLREVKRLWDPQAVTPLGNARHIARAGLAAAELDWWQATEVAGLRVTLVPAQHFSARYGPDRDRDLWGGFVVEAPGGEAVYFAGDSGWCPHFAEIGRRFPRLDLALLPIGAYEPRWFVGPEHMAPEEAVQAHLALRPRRSLAMHFGTIAGMTDEPWDDPPRKLAEALAREGVPAEEFAVPAFGASYEFAV